jgi:DNA-binding GntR family transcriptional regulator
MENTIEYYDLSLLAYKRIKEMILNDELKGGEKIIQEKLAIELGVSRMPLHKAFQMLENELLVESLPRKGYYVTKFDLNDIKDAFECREAIEGIAARKAAERITKLQVVELYELFKPFENNLDNADIKLYEEADNKFHKLILTNSGNKVLQRMEMFGNIIKRTYLRGLVRGPKDTYSEHIEIIKALEDKNGELAEQLLREHFRKAQKVISEKLALGS